MIIIGILFLLILAIALIALAIIYWYISIPIIFLCVLYYKRNNISSWSKQVKNEKNAQSKFNGKSWDICKEFGLNENEATIIFGNDWKSFTKTSQIFEFCLSKCSNQKTLLAMPKYLILKQSEILQSAFVAHNYEVYHQTPTLNYNSYEIQNRYNSAIQMCNNCYENYAHLNQDAKDNFDFNQSNSESNDSQDRYRHKYQGTGSNSKDSRINSRLGKFGISENEAEIIFGKRWKSILGKQELQFFFDVWSLDLKIKYDPYGRQKKKLGNLYNKALEIIRIVDQENPEMARKKNEQTQDTEYENYEYTYEEFQSEQNSEFDYDDTKNMEWAFVIFGLKRDSTNEDVKKRYRELSLKFHPDRNKSIEATKKMAEINNAYEILMEGRRASAS